MKAMLKWMFLVSVFLLALGSTCFAENWNQVAKYSSGNEFYVDSDSMWYNDPELVGGAFIKKVEPASGRFFIWTLRFKYRAPRNYDCQYSDIGVYDAQGRLQGFLPDSSVFEKGETPMALSCRWIMEHLGYWY